MMGRPVRSLTAASVSPLAQPRAAERFARGAIGLVERRLEDHRQGKPIGQLRQRVGDAQRQIVRLDHARPQNPQQRPARPTTCRPGMSFSCDLGDSPGPWRSSELLSSRQSGSVLGLGLQLELHRQLIDLRGQDEIVFRQPADGMRRELDGDIADIRSGAGRDDGPRPRRLGRCAEEVEGGGEILDAPVAADAFAVGRRRQPGTCARWSRTCSGVRGARRPRTAHNVGGPVRSWLLSSCLPFTILTKARRPCTPVTADCGLQIADCKTVERLFDLRSGICNLQWRAARPMEKEETPGRPSPRGRTP